MAHAENSLKDLKEEKLISLVLSLQNEQENYTKKFVAHMSNIAATGESLAAELEQVKLSLIVSKTVNDVLTNGVTSFERSHLALEEYSTT